VPDVALPTDVSRSDENAKRAFETVFEAMVNVLERSAIEYGQPPPHHRSGHRRVVLGRHGGGPAMVSRAAADELREACMSVALRSPDVIRLTAIAKTP
jgi:hypothetical protein